MLRSYFAARDLGGACSFTNVINQLNDDTAVYMYDLSDTPQARLARGPKAASAPHATGKLLIAAVVAVAALAAVGMSEAAMAQTTEKIKIGVLSASLPIFEEGPNLAMEAARDAWNEESSAHFNAELELKFIDIRGNFSDPAHGLFVGQQIGAAAQDGYKHFIAPSDDQALFVVQQVVNNIPTLSDTILISPASQSTLPPSLAADDNLFRLAPNVATQGERLLEQFDRQGVGSVIIVTDAAFEPLVEQGFFPDDLHDHYQPDAIPIYGFNDLAANTESLIQLNDDLTALIDQHGSDRIGVFAATQPPTFVTMAHAIAANPQLTVLDDVKWFGYNYLGHSPFITGDPTAAAFADRVDMNVVVFEIASTDVNAPLAELPTFSPGFRNFNFASYDAVHLLADVLAIGGVDGDGADLKAVIFDVANNNMDPVPHENRILGEGAMGDYMLDPATGDLTETRAYVVYHVVEVADGVYDWVALAPPNVCR